MTQNYAPANYTADLTPQDAETDKDISPVVANAILAGTPPPPSVSTGSSPTLWDRMSSYMADQTSQPPYATGVPNQSPQAPILAAPQSAPPIAQGSPTLDSFGGNAQKGPTVPQGAQFSPAIASLLQGGGATGGSARAVGLSPADKTYDQSLLANQARDRQTAANYLQQVGDNAKQFAAQNDAFTAESRAGIQAFQQQNSENEEHRKKLAQEAKDAQDRIQAKLGQLESQGIDPNKYWHDSGVAGTILSGIAIGLGQFGAQLGHGQNAALSIINGAIDSSIRSQEVNLQHALEIAGKGSELNAQGFNQQDALLKAKMDSTLTAYTLAQNELQKRVAAFGQNQDVQTNAQKLSMGIQDSVNGKIDAINQQRYQLKKNAEKVVPVGSGSSADVAKQIRETATKLTLEKGLPPDEALRQAAHLMLGVNLQPNAPETAIPGTGKAGQLSPRIAKSVADYDAGIAAIQQLKKLQESGINTIGERAQAGVLAHQVQALGINVPDNPLAFSSKFFGSADSIDAAGKEIENKRAALLRRGTSGGSESEGDLADKVEPE